MFPIIPIYLPLVPPGGEWPPGERDTTTTIFLHQIGHIEPDLTRGCHVFVNGVDVHVDRARNTVESMIAAYLMPAINYPS